MSRRTSEKVLASRLVVPGTPRRRPSAALGLVAVGDGGGDQPAIARHALADGGRQDDVDRHRHMRPVLLGGTQGQEHGDSFLHLPLELRPGQLGQEHALRHPHPLIHASMHPARTSPPRRSRLMHCPVIKWRPAGQEHGRCRDLLRLRDASRVQRLLGQRLGRVEPGPSMGVSVGPGAMALTRIGARTRAPRSGSSTAPRPWRRSRPAVLAAEIGQLRGHVDDPAPALAGHGADRLAADQEHAAQIDRDQPVELWRLWCPGAACRAGCRHC